MVSSEADIDVAELYRDTRIFIEKQVNSNLDEITFDHDYDKWAFIVMIRDSKNWADEVAKRHIKRKVLEFRLKIDHNEFLMVISLNEPIYFWMLYNALLIRWKI